MSKKKILKPGDVIYIPMSLSKKCFFIARGRKDTLRETYRHHLQKRRSNSLSLIEHIAPERPCLFILEEIHTDEPDNLMLVWLRILREHGFESFNSPEIIELSEHLYFDNQMAYDKRKDINLENVLTCSNCQLPSYNRTVCVHYPKVMEQDPLPAKISRKRNIKVTLMVTDDEWDIICANAKRTGKQTKAFIHAAAINPTICVFNYKTISEHTRQIGEICEAINRLIFTIDASNNYLPREIESIVNMMKEVFESENKLIKTLRKYREEMRDILGKGIAASEEELRK